MATYESYKDSGVKWLGQIPSHWEVKKLRAFFSEVCESNSALKVHNQLQFKYGTIVPKPDTGVDDAVLKTISKYTVVNPGDIIINGLNLNYDFISFRVGKVNEQGVITSAYIAMRPNNGLSPKFYEYMLKAMDAKKVFHGFGTGIRATLSFKELKHKLLPLVPLNEQEAIVAYLDKVTGDIDRAIEAQQKMIDALNERKQIIITRAVTRGLNPDAPLRDSGIDWLGQIPEHWEVTKVKYITYNLDRLRKPITADQRSRNNPKYDYYGASGAIDKIDFYCVEDRVLLIGEDGANLVMRNLPLIYKAEGRFWVNNHAHILKEKPGYDYDYLAFLLEAGDYTNFITGSAQPKLTKSNLGAYPVAVPPYEEQISIVDFINRMVKPIDDSLSKISAMISLLQERKQIIINEVVTGKTKVI